VRAAAMPDVQTGGGAAVRHGPEGRPKTAGRGKFDARLHVAVELGPFIIALDQAGRVVARRAGGVVVVVTVAFFGFEMGVAAGNRNVFRGVTLQLAGLEAVPRETRGPERLIQ